MKQLFSTFVSGKLHMSIYRVIGVMSGSSMDGVDLAYCEFSKQKDKWKFKIKDAETIPYPEVWINRLTLLHKQPIFLYPKTDAYYGKYLGQLVNSFIKKHKLKVDLIASHGHTIFHNPNEGYTAQIGDGAYIHAETNLPVVCDFRTVDLALGGQGAPLVPIGDRELFSGYDACLNLGGFANISFTKNKTVIAFDICPCNTILNKVANVMDLPFDDEGKMAAKGRVKNVLLKKLNALAYYEKHTAKSLGQEWLNEYFWPTLKQSKSISTHDLLATFTEHISTQIVSEIHQSKSKKTLLTGGGAHNKHLIQLIETKTDSELIIPDKKIINFKEALIFAFLGVLRLRSETNSLSSVTGAFRNNIGGALFGPVIPD